jgi:exosortase B
MTELDRPVGLPAGGSQRAPVPLLVAGVALLSLLVAYGPTLYQLATTVWISDTQGQGPVVLVLGMWLLWRRVKESGLAVQATPRVPAGAAVVLVACALLLVLGGVLAVPTFEVFSMLPVLACVLAILYGPEILRRTWFPLVLMVFMVPLPETVVGTITLPMKIAVSVCAEALMRLVDIPVARSGVVLYVDQYQLLIADACAGLSTLFTLEAIGLMYIELFKFDSTGRNVALSVLVVPIAFIANVLRVVTLCLLTYFFGDAVGQGFLHEGAGIFLFVCATAALALTDKALQRLFRKR